MSKYYIPILPPDGEPGQHLAFDSSRGLYWSPPLKREDDDHQIMRNAEIKKEHP